MARDEISDLDAQEESDVLEESLEAETLPEEEPVIGIETPEADAIEQAQLIPDAGEDYEG
ncbi:hypothetical protein Lfu02_24790 [Longispora fulva]|uniref:Uncharacterized protein n=1 Tax=Longispora fulva TaxID=619741 RepID=A0A8J7GKU3_9ACTN|nr:hypothetical protein [Longispora fulva]MBG6139510.1 hypothetical protein [Longispora fulva]GIG58107.1 hypothetical protein Lfu02_24790 [Longispora fulva]